ncbi:MULTISPECIES: GNAT family N-acetyltransferase [unclassified Pseudoalteromonas]|uniref:GNAT family N-acetyltransferase n=1 Tax=unclassified Pseudoalteromonas TaxID=194690 RepID=UPI000C7C3A52|nr:MULTISPECIES: GNAT family N-acetyltransferase [unclassified Pseudoalteromonas]AUJ72546.1 Acetyltransferase (GNAT) family protein [Pseudoalteromonas sp. NC201]MCF2828052.1 GNAT family N-acetyltransferase [Pseudoalteromonas sp. OF5H-5]MCF2833375.1 GNAT family N-acetyltransferase [Pseudoalteromonas sp. DL2-H6]MCF2924165.1 GNAT family N-acetyltransferase [Pseudoalteromonas sp. DL2-H1]QUI68803.1 GNAT family N-acetyltransferase [Pseudoalteromonas sp. M8]
MIEIISTPTRDIVEQLTELYIATFSAPPRNEEIDQAAIRLLMEKEIEEGEVRVIFDDSTKQLIGSLSLVPIAHFKDKARFDLTSGLYISNFMVDANIRGKGIGKQLLQDTLAATRQPIHTRCRVDALAVNHLFQRHGFKLVANYTTIMNNSVAARNIYTYQAE